MPQDQTSRIITTKNIWTGVVIVVAVLLLVWWYMVSLSNKPKTDFNELRLQFVENAQKNASKISGQIQHIDAQGGTKKLDVQIQILDLTSSSSDSTLPATTLPGVIPKTITILVDGKTTIEGTNDFKVGDTINALLDKSVYQGTDFHAVKISIYNRVEEIKKQVLNLNLIHGSIKELGSNFFVIDTKVPDEAKVSALNFSGAFTVPYVDKEYKILIDNSTQFIGGKRSDMKVGGSISIWGDGDLLNVSSFTATKILYEQ